MKKLLPTLTTLMLATSVQAQDVLSLSYTPFTTKDGFKDDAFCADTTLKRGQTIGIDVKLPQKDPNADTHQTYGLVIFPAVKVRLVNPKGEPLTMEKWANRYPSLSPHKTLVAPPYYESKEDFHSNALQYAHHEGIYQLTALENQSVKICIRNNGFGTKFSHIRYPSTRLSDYKAVRP